MHHQMHELHVRQSEPVIYFTLAGIEAMPFRSMASRSQMAVHGFKWAGEPPTNGCPECGRMSFSDITVYYQRDNKCCFLFVHETNDDGTQISPPVEDNRLICYHSYARETFWREWTSSSSVDVQPLVSQDTQPSLPILFTKAAHPFGSRSRFS